MRIILAGYLETAFVHYSDAIIRPNRNSTTHGYYMCVNRRVPKAYFDRASTFIALANDVIVPSLDWGLPPLADGPPELSTDILGVSLNGDNEYGGREWDDDTKIFSEALIKNHALSRESWVHASAVNFGPLEASKGHLSDQEKTQIRIQIGIHYLCRLFLQVRATAESGAFLALSEPDISLLQDVGVFLLKTGMPSPFAFPDLTGQTINDEDFAAGLLNFSPPDALSLAAVKRDPTIKKYAERIRPFIKDAVSESSQNTLLAAMRDAYQHDLIGKKAEKIFEIASWCVKPLHYVPGIGEALTLAEDAKDAVGKWIGRKNDDTEWYLLGARMNDIAIKDFLARKGNQQA